MNDNEFPVAELMPSNPSAVESMERAQIDSQIATARKYPRSLVQVKKEMMSMATMDVETAESCFYNLPRGGKSIPGPSIRLAEIALSCFGNLRAQTRIISSTLGDDPHVVIQAICHDLEKNSAVSIEKRRRITKKKSKDRPDEDDINLATNACSAIAMRDAVFKIVPGVLIKPVYDAARRVAIGDDKTLVDRRARAIDSLAKMGVTQDRICAALEIKSVEEINLEHLDTLTGFRNAIKDGQATIDETFPAIQKAAKAGMFGTDQKPAATPEPPKDEAKMATPTAPPANTQAQATQSETKANPLANDKSRLSEWFLKNNLGWGQVQKAVSQEFGAWADSVADINDLSMQQAKVIFNAREELLSIIQKP